MPLISSGELLDVRGELRIENATITRKNGTWNRNDFGQETLVADTVDLMTLRTWDDMTAFLPGTAASDDLAFIEGTFGTDAPTVQSSDGKATTITQRARFQYPLTECYDPGETIQVRIRAGMITTVSDSTATIDVECYLHDADGSVGSDLCTTAAQDINSLTKGNDDFTITSTGFVVGDTLDIRVTIAITDSATGTAVIGEISRIQILRDIRG